MTGKADFSAEEWEVVLKGPPSAGMIVLTAQRGGTFRETFSMAKAYAEARRQHGDSEMLDEIASTKPEIDHTRYHSPEELKEHGLQHVREAVELLERKATPQEVEEYRRFVLSLASRVAEARKEGLLGLSGERVSEAERAAVAEIAEALGAESP
jgi:DNA-binding transcriptional regulator GbsR (MarR family)